MIGAATPEHPTQGESTEREGDFEGRAGSPNAFAISRLNAEFLLQNLANIRELVGADLLTSLVFLAIWLESIRHVPYSAPAPIPDHRPVFVREVADRLKIPYETVRRHVNILVKTGHCARKKGQGVVLASMVFEQTRTLTDQQERTAGFVSAIANAGVELAR